MLKEAVMFYLIFVSTVRYWICCGHINSRKRKSVKVLYFEDFEGIRVKGMISTFNVRKGMILTFSVRSLC